MPRPALVRASLVAAYAGLGATTAVTITAKTLSQLTAADGKTAAACPRVYSYKVAIPGSLEILMQRSSSVPDRRSDTIDVHLTRLRSKLAYAGPRIETVRGVGHRIVPS